MIIIINMHTAAGESINYAEIRTKLVKNTFNFMIMLRILTDKDAYFTINTINTGNNEGCNRGNSIHERYGSIHL